MRRFGGILGGFLIVVAGAFAPATAQEASWLRTSVLPNALNPKLSVIGDFVARTGRTAATSGVALREVELAFQADVDPYARADFFVSKPEAENLEVEEGYVTLLALPLGLQARAGKFLANFGKLNLIHHPELPQVNAPLVLERFLGEEGLNSVGGEVSRVFAPGDVFTEVSYGLLRDLGPAGEPEAATAEVLDTSGNPVTVRVSRESSTPEGNKIASYGHVARGRAYVDITDAWNIEGGLSGALRQPGGFEHRKMLGTDLTLRWKPLREGQYRSFIWRSEFLYSERRLLAVTNALTGAEDEPPFRTARGGVYSYAEYQPAKRWRLGLRYDYAEDPTSRGRRSPTRAVAPYVTFTLSEFQKFRLQWEHQRSPNNTNNHLGFFQWVVVLGPHGAHAF